MEGRPKLGIDASVFMPEEKLHFTLLMLSLETPAHVQQACEAVKHVVKSFGEEGEGGEEKLQMTLRCKGLDVFPPGRPSAARVLFTKLPEEEGEALGKLHSLSRAIAGEMRNRDLFVDEQEMETALTSNFHVTLMNYKYRSNGGRGRGKGQGQGQGGGTFNVSELIELFGENFRLDPVSDIEVTVSSLRKRAQGYYFNEISVPLSNAQSQSES